MNDTEIRQALLSGLVTVALRPAGDFGEGALAQFEKLPLAALGAIGQAENRILHAAKSGETLYQICFQDGSLEQLAMKKVRRALIRELAKTIPAAELALQPGIFAVAAAVLTVGRQVEILRRTQDTIRGFLRQQNEAKLQRDLETLAATPEEMQGRSGDAAFRAERLAQVREIRRDAQRNLILYRLRIGDALDGKAALQTENALRRRLDEAQSAFRFYQLSVYLFAFAVYLEATLPEDFSAEGLRGAREKIRREADRYEQLFARSMERVETLSRSTVRARAARGFAAAKRRTGETAAKLPVIGASQVDEQLVATGARIARLSDEHGEALARGFRLYQESGAEVFAEQLEKLEALCGSGEILLDGENVYFKKA